MNNMMEARYMVFTSYGTALLFSPRTGLYLKRFLQLDKVKAMLEEGSGFRIKNIEHNSITMIVKSRHVLATAAEHFIPITGRPSFKILDPLDVSAVPFSRLAEN